MVAATPERIWVTVLWHFGVLFVIALGCHGALALDRPAPRHLTEFYLLISVGGVLGGLFNALLAPLIFSSLIEYPLVMVLACVLLRADRGDAGLGLGTGAWRAAVAVLVIAALALVLYSEIGHAPGGLLVPRPSFGVERGPGRRVARSGRAVAQPRPDLRAAAAARVAPAPPAAPPRS